MNLQNPDWVSELEAALVREFADRPRIASLATVDAAGHPQVRSIVIRELAPDGSIWFVTDQRSEKVVELTANANVQLVFWLPSQRVQYRLSGEARREVDLASVESHWSKLSEATKAMFFWNAEPLSAGGFANTQAAGQTDPPVNFAVYRVYVEKIDFLSLNETPHLRWVACQMAGWSRQPIAP